ncbi:Transcription factor MafA [Orchesella cincta]|uniref:Transcription factor MafA n=1 Tax=Orchesella cincta TaxID=48709 RepID=A0A1D2N603_ORCCI|nr:Transcription factor MafA [Orchesella cincta]
MYSNLSVANRQHLLQVKTLPSTPPATPPEGSPTQYHTGSPHFQRAQPVGGHTPHCEHDGGRGHMVEEIGMWNQGGMEPDSYSMNHEPIPINLSQNCPAGIVDNMWIPKEHQVIHGGVGSPQPYIPHAHGHGLPHHAHMHHHHPHTRSHHRSQSLESTKDSSSYSSSGSNGPLPRGQGGNPMEIPDEVLTSKPVRELNKLLHGYPRDAIVKLKQKRRTLKNRGYAQNCRTKRLHQKNQLEVTNKVLKDQIDKLTQDRDFWKSKATDLHRRFQHLEMAAASANNANAVSIAAAAAAAAAGNNHNGPAHSHSGSANATNNGLNSAHLHHSNGQLSSNQQQQHSHPRLNVPATSSTSGSSSNNANPSGAANGRIAGGNLESGIYSAETSTTSSPDSTYY